MSAVALAALAAITFGLQLDDDFVGPIDVVDDGGGPVVIARWNPTPSLVALRLSVAIDEATSLPGAARVLQELARESLEAEAGRLGARIELSTTAAHAVYAVSGPAEAVDDLIALLGRAVGPPSVSMRGFESARVAVQWEAAAALETPAGLVRRRLQKAMFPLLPAPSAAPAALTPLRPSDLDAFWRRSYRPARMTLVAVGPVRAERVAAAAADWPEPEAAGREPSYEPRVDVAPVDGPAPQVVAPWVGLGYPVEGEDPVAVAIAARLIGDRLGALELRDGAVELWWDAGRLGVAVIAAALPGDPTGADGRGTGSPAGRLESWVRQAANEASAAAIRRARDELDRQILFLARTPTGLASLIGELADRAGEPEAAAEFVDALGRIDGVAVHEVLDRIALQAPIRVEVLP